MDDDARHSREKMKLFVEKWVKTRPVSQEEIARATGIPQVQLSRFEHLKLPHDVMKRYQRKICSHFKIEPEEIMEGKTSLRKGRRPRIRYTKRMKTILTKFVNEHGDTPIPEGEQKLMARSLGIKLNNVKYYISNHKQRKKRGDGRESTERRIGGIKESTLEEMARDLKIKNADSELSLKTRDFINDFVPWNDKFYADRM